MKKTTSNYINRELSWLEFNQRVLDEARSSGMPLLERLRFLAISSSNLDEFFMVRVGGLQVLCEHGRGGVDPSGMTPDEQLAAIRLRTKQLVDEQYRCYLQELEPGLAQAGIRRIKPSQLTTRQERILEQVFASEIYSVLSPIAVTSTDDFPLLSNHSLNVAVQLGPDPDGEPRFAVVPFGRAQNRFITLPSDGGYDYILLEDVVTKFIEQFFPGEPIVACTAFRISRNADLAVREDQAADLLEQIELVLDARKESACVRLEIAEGVADGLLAFLQRILAVDAADIYRTLEPLDLAAFMRLTEVSGFDHLRYEPWPTQPPSRVDLGSSMFSVIADGDLLLYHPYESFEPVVRLIEEAASDPDVLAIKQTLYRTSRDSPIVRALAQAAERGKYVTAVVELKARFDEARNIEWAKSLEQSGVQVVYGVKGLKTHAKVCIIVRREPHGIQRYVHFGTGNYNEVTARIYCDVSLVTCNEELGADATSFFNAVTGYSQPQKYRRIEAAPTGLREKLLEMIQIETEHKRHGQKARIMAKLNSLSDPKIIDALYEASQAGVRIRLNVRGICCLRPGVRGLSEKISVVSIVDRFLEHSRILYFHHGGDERVFISSADWMLRNLNRRVELLVPVEDRACRDRLIGFLETSLKDTAKARRLRSDGSYEPVTPEPGQPPFRSQEALYAQACESAKRAEQSRRTVFQPYRAAEIA